jgi:ABC-type sugar transport system ATPase subunit
MRDHGQSVIFISRAMPQIFAVADRITVLRRGRKVADKPMCATSPEEVTALITGALEQASGLMRRCWAAGFIGGDALYGLFDSVIKTAVLKVK